MITRIELVPQIQHFLHVTLYIIINYYDKQQLIRKYTTSHLELSHEMEHCQQYNVSSLLSAKFRHYQEN